MSPIEGETRCVAWGEVLWDLFPDGRRLGGAPANVAYHLAALGARASLVSRIGDDETGRAARTGLAAAGVGVSAVQIDPRRATGAVGVELVDGEARYRFHPDGAWEHIEFDDVARAEVTAAGAICFGTLSNRRPAARAAVDAALAAARTAASARATPFLALCDLNLRPGDRDMDLVRWAIAAADVVKFNQREEAELTRLLDRRDLVAWLLGDAGCSAVAVTRGERGCRLVVRCGSDVIDVEHGGHPAEPGGDTVGCGDSVSAVLTLGLLRRAAPAQIAQTACKYAAFVAGRRGAMPTIPAALAAEVGAALRPEV